jgi:purine nucleosidase
MKFLNQSLNPSVMFNFLFYKAITGFVIVLIVMGCSNQIDQSDQPVNIIFDTDMTTDCDDAGALAMLHALERRGEANILATVVNNMGEHSSGATAAINAFYNRPDIPVGAYQGDRVGRDAAGFFSDIAMDKESYGHTASTRNQFPDAVEVYRKVLAEAGQHEVVIVSVGHLNNLYGLLESEADQYSELNGVELVEEKVNHLVVMGGHYLPQTSDRYPYGREHNFWARGSAEFTGPVLDRWPTRVLLSGYEIGENILTGTRLTELDENHPVRYAYAHHPSEPLVNGRMSWDQTAILAAVRDPGLYWDMSEPGRVEADEEGYNSWISDPEGLHVYLIERNNPGPSEIAEIIEELMLDMP